MFFGNELSQTSYVKALVGIMYCKKEIIFWGNKLESGIK